jgi:hypothetical protein
MLDKSNEEKIEGHLIALQQAVIELQRSVFVLQGRIDSEVESRAATPTRPGGDVVMPYRLFREIWTGLDNAAAGRVKDLRPFVEELKKDFDEVARNQPGDRFYPKT